jgi:hypothetical protein
MTRLAIAAGCLLTVSVASTAGAQGKADFIEPYRGTWRGVIYNRARDSVMVTWQWVQGSDSTGRFTFAQESTFTSSRVVFASSDSIVFDLLSPLRFSPGHPYDGATQRYVALIRGDSVLGTVYTRLVDGRQGRRPFAGVRAVTPP